MEVIIHKNVWLDENHYAPIKLEKILTQFKAMFPFFIPLVKLCHMLLRDLNIDVMGHQLKFFITTKSWMNSVLSTGSLNHQDETPRKHYKA